MKEEPKPIQSVIPPADPPVPVPPRMPSDAQADVNGVRLQTFHIGSLDLAKAVQGAAGKFNDWSRDNLAMDVVCIEQSIHSVAMNLPSLDPSKPGGVQVMHHVILWVWHQPKRLPADVKVLLLQVQKLCDIWTTKVPSGTVKMDDMDYGFYEQMNKVKEANDKVWKW